MSDPHSQRSLPIAEADRTPQASPSSAKDRLEESKHIDLAEGTGEEFMDVADDDIVADGGTEIMRREDIEALTASCPPAAHLRESLLTTVPATSLAAILAKGPLASPPTDDVPEAGLKTELNQTLALHTTAVFGAPKTAPSPKMSPPLDDLGSDDFGGETKDNRTQPFDRNRLFNAVAAELKHHEAELEKRSGTTLASAAWRPAPLPRLDLVLSPTPPPPAPVNQLGATPPHGSPAFVAQQPYQRPTSIAPLAVDVAAPRSDLTPNFPPGQPPYMAPPPPKGSRRTHVLVAAIAGSVALCAAAAVIALFVVTASSNRWKAKATPAFVAKPSEPQNASSAVIELPDTLPQHSESVPAQEEDGAPASTVGELPSAARLDDAGGTAGPGQVGKTPGSVLPSTGHGPN